MPGWRRGIAVFAVLAAAHGCGGDTEEDPTGGVVTGTVFYSGTAQGRLAVAAFHEWPTLSAPEMYIWISSPSYPQDYRLDRLDPGDYYIFAFIDLPPVSATLPGEEDIKSTPTTTTHVSGTDPVKVDITIP
jgi:hypothetical protein